VCGFPAHGLPIDKGTFTDLWRTSFVSFFHVFLPLLNDELVKYPTAKAGGFDRMRVSLHEARAPVGHFLPQPMRVASSA
jgi:hypothetical protein